MTVVTLTVAFEKNGLSKILADDKEAKATKNEAAAKEKGEAAETAGNERREQYNTKLAHIGSSGTECVAGMADANKALGEALQRSKSCNEERAKARKRTRR